MIVLQAVMPAPGCEQAELDAFAALASEHQSRQVYLVYWHVALDWLFAKGSPCMLVTCSMCMCVTPDA